MPQDLIEIKAVVEGEFNHINICEKSRERKYVDAIKIYSYIADRCTKYTRAAIGAFINRNHSTITVAIKRHNELMEVDDDFKDKARLCMLKSANILNKRTVTYKERIDTLFTKLSNRQQEELYIKATQFYTLNNKEITNVN
tara:strand:- start:37 stop:459 length:423 start_codon:yes stop_codon:yes gene_type:complete